MIHLWDGLKCFKCGVVATKAAGCADCMGAILACDTHIVDATQLRELGHAAKKSIGGHRLWNLNKGEMPVLVNGVSRGPRSRPRRLVPRKKRYR